jgi:hypothetical protein
MHAFVLHTYSPSSPPPKNPPPGSLKSPTLPPQSGGSAPNKNTANKAWSALSTPLSPVTKPLKRLGVPRWGRRRMGVREGRRWAVECVCFSSLPSCPKQRLTAGMCAGRCDSDWTGVDCFGDEFTCFVRFPPLSFDQNLLTVLDSSAPPSLDVPVVALMTIIVALAATICL